LDCFRSPQKAFDRYANSDITTIIIEIGRSIYKTLAFINASFDALWQK
jgi:hypothetical protein